MDGRRILDLGSNCLLELIETRLAAWFLHPEIGGMLIKFLLELRTTGSEWRLRRTLHSRPERWLTGLVLASEVLDALQLLSQPCNIFDSLDTLRDVLRDLPRANSFGNYPSELGDRLAALAVPATAPAPKETKDAAIAIVAVTANSIAKSSRMPWSWSRRSLRADP